MTPGSVNITATDINEKKLEEIGTELKEQRFIWNPAKRIYVEKPGNKKKKRPLGINDFKNKIVQEAIRMILESIYEPEFESLNTNSGFRPNKDCAYAIEKIKKEAQFSNLVIEGDIVGAYDNVDHEILFDILKRRIKDKKLLKLIYKGFKAGIVEEKTYIDTFLGIPQGGVCSPILFNIYMHEFDIFMTQELPRIIEEIDINSNKSRKIYEDSTYRSIRYQRSKLNNEIKKEELDNEITKKDIRTLIITIKENKQLFSEDIWNDIINRGEKYVGKIRTKKMQNKMPKLSILRKKSKIILTKNRKKY